MAVFFDTIPSGTLAPFTYVEFSNRLRDNLTNTQVYKCLILGQKSPSGTAKENEFNTITSMQDAAILYGVESSIYKSLAAFRANNHDTEVVLCSQEAVKSATSSKVVYTLSGTAESDGTVVIRYKQKEYPLTVSTGDTAVQIAALATDLKIPDFKITIQTDSITFETVEKGAISSLFYTTITSNATGISVAPKSKTAGTGTPDLTPVITKLDNSDDVYNIIISNYNDDANIAGLKTLLADRWSASKQLDGILFTYTNGAIADILKLKAANKSKYIVNVACVEPSYSSPYEVASAYAALVAKYAQVDSARPFQTLELNGIVPDDADRKLSLQNRELLLRAGFATYLTNNFGEVLVDRCVTSYTKDSAYRDLNTLLVLSFLRYDFRNRIRQKFPRHKLANDSERFTANQPIVTPLIARAEAMGIFNNWESLGLIQNVEYLKNTLTVELDTQDSNRLVMSLPVDLVNQLRVTAVQINFSV